MDRLITAWLYFERTVYWIGWLGSMAIFNVSIGVGILIGVGMWLLWFIILNGFSYIKDGSFVWHW